jgi:hypothetical protein
MSIGYQSGSENRTRTYGGWRRSRRIGIMGAGLGGSSFLVGAWTLLALLGTVDIIWYLYLGPAVAAVSAGVLLRWNNETLATRVTRRVRWWWAGVSRFTQFSLPAVQEYTGHPELPGLLAPTRLLYVQDGWGRRFGLVHHQRTGWLAATIRCDARGTALVDTEDADRWVASWGAWLADLGLRPMVSSVAVTVEVAPEPGATLTQMVTERMDPQAPIDAQTLLVDLLEASPRAAADVDTRVTITFDPAAGLVPLRRLEDQVGEVSLSLDTLESSLAGCGVGVLGRCSAAELSGIVTTAFNPDRRGEVNRLLADKDQSRAEAELLWELSGPTEAEELWDCYRHGNAWSVTYGWVEPPRQQVTSNVLARLMAPGRSPRRVTLLYRAYPAAEAAAKLEEQVNAVMFRQGFRQKRGLDEKARDQADRVQARQAAEEEAQGAGLVRMSLYATTTVTDRAELARACADVEARSQECKIPLKKLVGSQAAGFAYTLPAGLHPVAMAVRSRR